MAVARAGTTATATGSMCSILDMDDWGPFTTNFHCEHLSFTLLFEEVVMAITPAACALVIALVRMAFLVREKTKTDRTILYALKLVSAISLIADRSLDTQPSCMH